MANITFIGDLLCYPSMTERFGPDYDELYKRVTKLNNGDYVIANLESPIAGEEMRYTFERYCFNTPIGFIRALKKIGVKLITLANNHCMDRGETGLLKTLENCRREGFETIGLYESEKERDELFIKDFDGIKVAFVNYTYGTNAFAHGRFLEHKYMVNLFQPEETKKGSVHLLDSNETIGEHVNRIYGKQTDEYDCVKPYLEQLKKDIQRAKQDADYVIAVLHCGGQYNEEVDPYTEYVYRRVKEFGADMIVGNHPHIIQKSDNKDGYLTVFSLGNFMDSPEIVGEKSLDFRYNAVLHISLAKENGKTTAEKRFGLYKVVETDEDLYAADAYELYQESGDPKLKEEILFYANRFAGEQKYSQVQEYYDL